MAKFKNTVTGVVVSVADDKADRFGADWELVDEPKAKSTAKPTAKK